MIEVLAPTIHALALMCALSPLGCRSHDARAIAAAVDAATEDARLRAVLVVYAWHESRWQLEPPAVSWDARAGIARGPWQLWTRERLSVKAQAATWLRWVQTSGVGQIDSSPRRAYQRLVQAERVLQFAVGE